ncbi:protein of unknown function [Rhodovastum atsumiense]|nr:protein of unknown function [Rhodovastum atsumiense]
MAPLSRTHVVTCRPCAAAGCRSGSVSIHSPAAPRNREEKLTKIGREIFAWLDEVRPFVVARRIGTAPHAAVNPLARPLAKPLDPADRRRLAHARRHAGRIGPRTGLPAPGGGMCRSPRRKS